MQEALIISNCGETCRLVVDVPVKVLCDGREVLCKEENGAIVFDTCAGKSYEIKTA